MWDKVCLACSLPSNKEFILHIELCQWACEEKMHAARLGVICSRGYFHPSPVFMNSIKVNSLDLNATYRCVLARHCAASWALLGKSFHAPWRELRQTSQGVGSTGMLKLWILFYLYYTDLKPKEGLSTLWVATVTAPVKERCWIIS